MIHHIVFWKLRDQAEGHSAEENRQEVMRLLKALPALIPQIRTLEVGKNLGSSPAAWDLGLYTTFDNLEALKSYQLHPEHQKVAEFVGKVVCDRAVVDFEG